MYGINKTPEQRALDFKIFLESKGVGDLRVDENIVYCYSYKYWFGIIFEETEDVLTLKRDMDLQPLGIDRDDLIEFCNLANTKCLPKYYVDDDRELLICDMYVICPVDRIFEETYKRIRKKQHP